MASGGEQAREIVLIGAGGHARVVAEAWRAAGRAPITGIVVEKPDDQGERLASALDAWCRDDAWLKARACDRFLLLNGIGLTPGRRIRLAVARSYRAAGFRFAAVIHPAAVIARDCRIADGAQVMAGAVLQPGVRLGEDAIVNTGASVDHDCVIGAGAHLAPGCVLCGGVTVGPGAFIGAGAVVLPGLSVGEGALVPAGFVLRGDVAAGARADTGP